MKPYVICHMIASLDGGLHPGRYTTSPDGSRDDWSAVYGELHERLDVAGWLVGRVAMAEMARGTPHAPADFEAPDRPVHVADADATSFAVALDQGGKLHFDASAIDGDQVVVLLGGTVSDAHLAELTAAGVSYVVADEAEIDLAAALDTLASAFGIHRLALEGGAGINGAFFSAGLIDELSVLVAPALDGRSGHRTIVEAGENGLGDTLQLRLIGHEALAHGTVHLRYAVSAA